MNMKRISFLILFLLVLSAVGRANAATTSNMNLYGDSIMKSLVPPATPGWTFYNRAVGGTAPCDMLPKLRADMASVNPPEVVLIEDIGNASTPCMAGASVNTTNYFIKYRQDFAALFLAARPAIVYYVAPPPMLKAGTNQVVSKIMAIAIDEAQKAGVTVIGAGRNSVSVNDQFVWYVNGQIVRKSDGVHLTPVGADIFIRATLGMVL
jgi:hypothetical protein